MVRNSDRKAIIRKYAEDHNLRYSEAARQLDLGERPANNRLVLPLLFPPEHDQSIGIPLPLASDPERYLIRVIGRNGVGRPWITINLTNQLIQRGYAHLIVGTPDHSWGGSDVIDASQPGARPEFLARLESMISDRSTGPLVVTVIDSPFDGINDEIHEIVKRLKPQMATTIFIMAEPAPTPGATAHSSIDVMPEGVNQILGSITREKARGSVFVRDNIRGLTVEHVSDSRERVVVDVREAIIKFGLNDEFDRVVVYPSTRSIELLKGMESVHSFPLVTSINSDATSLNLPNVSDNLKGFIHHLIFDWLNWAS